MEISLVCKTLRSNKFWRIKVQGYMFIVSYGKVGTVGTVKTKEFPSEENCYKEANKLIQSKFNKGYREIGEEEEITGTEMTEKQFWDL